MNFISAEVGGKNRTTKNVKTSLQPTQNSRRTSCLSVRLLWHVEFLNEQECVHKRLSSPLHLGKLHDVFVQMISLACRQPNYLSSSVSSKPKPTSTHSHTHTDTEACTHTIGLSELHSTPPLCHGSYHSAVITVPAGLSLVQLSSPSFWHSICAFSFFSQLLEMCIVLHIVFMCLCCHSRTVI